MDSFEFNKIAGAVLATALVVFGLKELSSAVYHTDSPEKPGYAIEVADAGATGNAQAATAAPAVALGTLLASADATKGAAGAKACAACHDFTKAGPNKTGPNLWDVVDRGIASHEGFSYSDGMKARSADKWTYENLNAFITNPKVTTPGTKMGFAGVKKDQARADIIAYLASLSDAPKPFPAP
ncbi:MAG: cytochrome c family protein [Aestuariivirga sp.]|jgi:cytochrome c